MNVLKLTVPSSGFAAGAMLALICALGLAALAPQARAGDAPALTALDGKAPAAPITATFDKGTDPDAGPYVLSLKNTSSASIKVSVSVQVSATFHANKKNKTIPDHVIDAGQVWTVPDLGAGDRVTVNAEGYAPLEVTAP